MVNRRHSTIAAGAPSISHSSFVFNVILSNQSPSNTITQSATKWLHQRPTITQYQSSSQLTFHHFSNSFSIFPLSSNTIVTGAVAAAITNHRHLSSSVVIFSIITFSINSWSGEFSACQVISQHTVISSAGHRQSTIIINHLSSHHHLHQFSSSLLPSAGPFGIFTTTFTLPLSAGARSLLSCISTPSSSTQF